MLSPIKNKRGISIIIGYVLLIVFAIIIGVVVYEWMKTYVPKEDLKCPDEISIFLKDYECTPQYLKLNLTNNGRFNIGGYLIYAKNYSQPGIAYIDISGMILSGGTSLSPTGVKMSGNYNSFYPDYQEHHEFGIYSISPQIYSIEITPIRWQESGRKTKLVNCVNSKIQEDINCQAQCSETPAQTCLGAECGIKLNSCFQEINCGTCGAGESCDASWQCVASGSCTDTCAGRECGIVCDNPCGTCSNPHGSTSCSNGGQCQPVCGPGWGNCDGNDVNGCETELGTDTHCSGCLNSCTSGKICVNYNCISCNGVWNSPEDPGIQCDGGSNCLPDCTCEEGYESDGNGGCIVDVPNTIDDVKDFCVSVGYANGFCRQNPAQCGVSDEVYVAEGDPYCAGGGSVADTCCCKPY
jgi:hypothetical protein